MRQEKGALEVEKKALQLKLDEAYSQAVVEPAAGPEITAKADQQCYRRGCEKSIKFFCKVLVTLSPTFSEEGYFDAYLQYVKECQWAEVEGRNPDQVEFNPPLVKGDNLKDEETTPLDVEVGPPDDEGRGAASDRGSDDDGVSDE